LGYSSSPTTTRWRHQQRRKKRKSVPELNDQSSYASLLLAVFVSFKLVPFQVYAMRPIFLPLLEAPPELTFRIVCRTLMDSSGIFGTLWKQCPFKCFCIFLNKEITVGQIRRIEAWATAMLLVVKNCCTD
jgi:hypothetical protein